MHARADKRGLLFLHRRLVANWPIERTLCRKSAASGPQGALDREGQVDGPFEKVTMTTCLES
jgi:hypothetical protein